jgi:Tfp pilus assembly protein PilN
MIRINLLGVPKPKKGKKSGGFAVPEFGGGGGGNPILVPAAVLIIAIGANFFYYNHLQDQAKAIAAEKQKKETERAALSNVKRKYDERKKQADLYERRVKVIDELRSQQSGPSKMLEMVAQTVNQTDAVWINVMKDEGAKIQIEGSALSNNAVANLITNLKKQEMVANVEMSEAIQDPAALKVDSFNFKLTIEKKPAAPVKG